MYFSVVNRLGQPAMESNSIEIPNPSPATPTNAMEPTPENSLANLVAMERQRLTDERVELTETRRQIDLRLQAVDREFKAVDAYEKAKQGTPARTRSRPGNGAERAPRGSRRAEVKTLLETNPNGLARGEILDQLGLKGNKIASMSISNALSAMLKSGELTRNDKNYQLSV
jgi:hypothetical protein